MMEFLAGLNWTAIIMTVAICYTVNRTVDRLRPLAKMWLEGLKINKETEAMRFGYQPRGNQKGDAIAWVESGTAVWRDESLPTRPTAKRATAEPGLPGLAAGGEMTGDDLVGKVPVTPERKKRR